MYIHVQILVVDIVRSENLSEVQMVELTLQIDSTFEITRCGKNDLQVNGSLDQI
jgi:hypothetical protein